MFTSCLLVLSIPATAVIIQATTGDLFMFFCGLIRVRSIRDVLRTPFTVSDLIELTDFSHNKLMSKIQPVVTM